MGTSRSRRTLRGWNYIGCRGGRYLGGSHPSWRGPRQRDSALESEVAEEVTCLAFLRNSLSEANLRVVEAKPRDGNVLHLHKRAGRAVGKRSLASCGVTVSKWRLGGSFELPKHWLSVTVRTQLDAGRCHRRHAAGIAVCCGYCSALCRHFPSNLEGYSSIC